MQTIFATSGFPNGFTIEFIDELRKHTENVKNAVFVASDFSAHEKTKRHIVRFVDMFHEKGIDFQKVDIVDNQIDPLSAVTLIKNADLVWLSGGATLLQIRDIKRYALIEALQQRNGVTIGMSAGSMNMAKRVVLPKDPHSDIPELSIYDGIGLIDINIEPHFNTATAEHIAEIEEAAKITPIYALCDDAFIKVLDDEMKIFGDYQVFSTLT